MSLDARITGKSSTGEVVTLARWIDNNELQSWLECSYDELMLSEPKRCLLVLSVDDLRKIRKKFNPRNTPFLCLLDNDKWKPLRKELKKVVEWMWKKGVSEVTYASTW